MADRSSVLMTRTVGSTLVSNICSASFMDSTWASENRLYIRIMTAKAPKNSKARGARLNERKDTTVHSIVVMLF